VVNPEDENVLPFITELKQKLSAPLPLNVNASYGTGLNEVVSKLTSLTQVSDLQP